LRWGVIGSQAIFDRELFFMQNILRLLILAAITVEALAACGGGSSSTNATPTPVMGVATPKTVSAVTAN